MPLLSVKLSSPAASEWPLSLDVVFFISAPCALHETLASLSCLGSSYTLTALQLTAGSDRPLPTLHDLPMAGPLNAQEFIRALKASSDPPYAGGPPKIEVARKAWDNVSLYVPNKAEAIVDWILSALLKEKSRQPFVYLPLPHMHRLTQ